MCAKPEPPRGTRSRALPGCSGVRARPRGGFSEVIWEKEAPAPEDSGAGSLWAGAAVGSGLPPGGQDQHKAAWGQGGVSSGWGMSKSSGRGRGWSLGSVRQGMLSSGCSLARVCVWVCVCVCVCVWCVCLWCVCVCVGCGCMCVCVGVCVCTRAAPPFQAWGPVWGWPSPGSYSHAFLAQERGQLKGMGANNVMLFSRTV